MLLLSFATFKVLLVRKVDFFFVGNETQKSNILTNSTFHKVSHTYELPKCRQVIRCLTREESILDPCYTTVSSPRSCTRSSSQHHGPADSCMKLCKPVVRTLKQWNCGGSCSCLDCTGWAVFMSGANSGGEYTEGQCCHISDSVRTAVYITQGYGGTSPHWTNAGKLRVSLTIRYTGPC